VPAQDEANVTGRGHAGQVVQQARGLAKSEWESAETAEEAGKKHCDEQGKRGAQYRRMHEQERPGQQVPGLKPDDPFSAQLVALSLKCFQPEPNDPHNISAQHGRHLSPQTSSHWTILLLLF
jgi:hypothetical protein